jgi:hypothetical protein
MSLLKVPLAVNSDNKPSATLLFAYVAFIETLLIIAWLAYKDALAGSVASLLFFFGSLFIYRMRLIDSFKINLESKTVEVDADGK